MDNWYRIASHSWKMDLDDGMTLLDLEQAGLLALILERMPAGVVVAGAPDGEVILSNSMLASILRCPASLRGSRWGQWAAGDPLAAVRLLTDQPWPLTLTLARGEVVPGQDLLVVRGDGSPVTLHASAFPVKDSDGQLVAGVMVLAEVTETRSAEDALRESEERYRSLVELSPDPIAVHSDGRLVLANLAGARLLGARSPAQIIGRPILDFIPLDIVPLVKARVQQVLQEGFAPLIEERFLRLDGTTVEVEVVGVRVTFRGKPASQLIIRDISSRRRVERAQRFMAQASDVLASSLNFDLTVEQVTRLAAPELADLCVVEVATDRGAVCGRAAAHVDPSVARQVLQLLEQGLKAPGAQQRYLDLLSSGRTLFVSDVRRFVSKGDVPGTAQLALLEPLDPGSYVHLPLLARGRSIGAMALCTTDPSRRLAQEDMPLFQEMARRAAVAIDNALLYRELQQADRSKDEFLAMLGHELRNPLAALTSAMENLQRGLNDDPKLRSAREAASRQLGHMRRLLDDLLDVSRITRGRIKLRLEALDLETVLRRSLQTTGQLMRERRHQLRVRFPPRPVRVKGDPARLEQIFCNLLSNAAKYTPPRGTISLETSYEEGQVLVRVIDSGVGIAPVILPHVFDLFVQGGPMLGRSQSGLGIGLTLVDRLVKMHGGAAWARSEGTGRGSEFTVRLPACLFSEAQAAGRLVTPRAAVPPPGLKRVLLVEDNEDVAEMLAMLLRSEGHDVHLAYDGEIAVKLMGELDPEVILLDIGLPGMNGFEVARRIRQMALAAQPRIIAITGYGLEPDRQRASEAGIDHYLVKPVNVAELKALI